MSSDVRDDPLWREHFPWLCAQLGRMDLQRELDEGVHPKIAERRDAVRRNKKQRSTLLTGLEKTDA